MENTRAEILRNDFSTVYRKKRLRINHKKVYSLKKKLIAFNVVATLVFVIIMSVIYTDMVNTSSDKLVLESTIEKLELEVNSLRAVVEPLKSDKRIEKIAKSSLDMIYPQSTSYVALEDNSNERIVNLTDLSLEGEKLSHNTNSFLSIISNLFR